MSSPEQHGLPAPEPSASRFRGAILGAAIGDALAFPNQHYSRAFLSSLAEPLASQYALPRNSLHPRGQYGAMTQILLAVAASIVENRAVTREGLVTHLLPLWRDNLLVEKEPSTTEAMHRILKGRAIPGAAGLEVGTADVAPAGRVVPIGLWDHASPERLVEDVGMAVRLSHQDPRALACGAAVAAAIATNVKTEAFVLGGFLDAMAAAAGAFDSVVRDAILDFPRTLCQSERRALRMLAAVCPDSRYSQSDEGLGEYCVPTLLSAIYWFLRFPLDYEKTVESCLRLGGQMGPCTFIAGAMSGALLGDDALPGPLVEGLLNAKEISRQAQLLCEASIAR